MRYNSHEYVNNYLAYGTFPKIHDDIFFMAKRVPGAGELNAIDLGACTGLLTIRMSGVFKSVTGIESSEDYAKKLQGAKIIIFKITPETVLEFGAVIAGYDIIIARRVFPELYDARQVVYFLPEVFYKAGIKYILLEGRKRVKRPTNPLWNADLEARVFSEYYTVADFYKDIRLLKRKT